MSLASQWAAAQVVPVDATTLGPGSNDLLIRVLVDVSDIAFYDSIGYETRAIDAANAVFNEVGGDFFGWDTEWSVDSLGLEMTLYIPLIDPKGAAAAAAGPGFGVLLPQQLVFTTSAIVIGLIAAALTAGAVIGVAIVLEPDAVRKLVLSVGVSGQAIIHGEVDEDLLAAASSKIEPGKTDKVLNIAMIGVLGYFLLPYLKVKA